MELNLLGLFQEGFDSWNRFPRRRRIGRWFYDAIDAGDLEESFQANSDLGEVQHVYRSEVGSGEGASRLVLQTETGKSREALSHLQNNSPNPHLLKKDSAILEARLANKSRVMPSSPYP